jgi:hypothetical protein
MFSSNSRGALDFPIRPSVGLLHEAMSQAPRSPMLKTGNTDLASLELPDFPLNLLELLAVADRANACQSLEEHAPFSLILSVKALKKLLCRHLAICTDGIRDRPRLTAYDNCSIVVAVHESLFLY